MNEIEIPEPLKTLTKSQILQLEKLKQVNKKIDELETELHGGIQEEKKEN